MFRNLKKLHNENGFSLLEVVLGVMIIAVSFLGLIPLMTNATAKTVNNDMYVVGTYLANDKIETIFADKNFLGFDTVNDAAYPNEDLNPDFPGFTRTTTVTEVSATNFSTPEAGSGYKKVVVTVWWGTGADKVVLTTLLTNY